MESLVNFRQPEFLNFEVFGIGDLVGVWSYNACGNRQMLEVGLKVCDKTLFMISDLETGWVSADYLKNGSNVHSKFCKVKVLKTFEFKTMDFEFNRPLLETESCKVYSPYSPDQSSETFNLMKIGQPFMTGHKTIAIKIDKSHYYDFDFCELYSAYKYHFKTGDDYELLLISQKPEVSIS